MLLHDREADSAFDGLIDCQFPYNSPSASALIRQGWATSLNAAFCVLHELCRPPRECAVSKARLRALVAEWAAGGDHPLKDPVLQAAHALIEGEPLPWRQGVALMERIGLFDGQRAALGIAYFASAEDEDDENSLALTRTNEEIRRRWDASVD